MFSRMCVCLFVLVYVVTVADTEESEVLTSPVLHRPRTNYLKFAGKTYYFGIIFKANFHRAMQFCRQQGMQLVSINSQIENERIGRFVQEIGQPSGLFWTSGTNLADENQWIWLSTGNNIVYSNWRPGEPSRTNKKNVPEHCLEARHFGPGFTWNDVICEYENYFICESSDSC